MTCCCSHESLEYKDLPEAFYGKKIENIHYDSTDVIVDEISTYEGHKYIGKKEFSIRIFPYDNKYFMVNNRIFIPYYDDIEMSWDKRDMYVIAIAEKGKETIQLLDTIEFEIQWTDLYVTQDYYYFRLLIDGRGEIHKPSDSLLVSGLLLFNREDEYKLFKYYQNKIILLEQKDDMFHVVTAGMSFEWDFLGEPFYSTFGTSKLTIASLYSNGKFTEYYYNQNLELVHSKGISEQKAIKLYKQSLKKRNKNIKQKE